MNKRGRNFLVFLIVSVVLVGTVAQTFGQDVGESPGSIDGVTQGGPAAIPMSDFSAASSDGILDIFLRIDGIPGESTDDKHKDEIEIEGFTWGETSSADAVMAEGKAMGGGRGKVNMQDVHIVMKLNKASPKLFLACANGQHIKNAVLTVRRAGEIPDEFLTWTFTDVLVTSYQTSGSNSALTDQFSLSFAQIEVEYKPPSGASVRAGWDLKKNRPI